ncbi:MAG: RICIN domain-containing protein [Coriobacteriales bacterium]|nr:RICIN domain-containing protein [Coriobacteriales bacterium]
MLSNKKEKVEKGTFMSEKSRATRSKSTKETKIFGLTQRTLSVLLAVVLAVTGFTTAPASAFGQQGQQGPAGNREAAGEDVTFTEDELMALAMANANESEEGDGASANGEGNAASNGEAAPLSEDSYMVETAEELIAALKAAPVTGESFVVELCADIDLEESSIEAPAGSNITLARASESDEELFSLKSANALQAAIVVQTDATLTLEGIKLSGKGGGVCNLGTFVLKNGEISGCGGSGVDNHGTFIMEDGSIAGNARANGAGVYNAGTFTMQDGAITGNIATGSGGGVYNNGTFSIEGGVISENVAELDGGGVYTKLYEALSIGAAASFSNNQAASAHDRAASTDEIYAATVACTKWTEPFTQGYNNYDINHTEGKELATIAKPAIIGGTTSIDLKPGYETVTVPYTISGATEEDVELIDNTAEAEMNNGVLVIPSGLAAGAYSVTILATNSGGTAKKTVDVMVARVNFSGLYTLGIADKTLGMNKKSRKDGALLTLQTKSYTPTQRFRIERVEKGKSKDYYTITNVLSDKRLEVKNGKLSKGAAIWQNKKTKLNSQRFSIAKNSSGGFWISPKGSKLVFALKGGKTVKGTQIVLADKDKTKATQLFTLDAVKQAVPNGTYMISSQTNATLALSVQGGAAANKSKMQVASNKKKVHQKWKLSYNKNTGYYNVVGIGSDRALDANGDSPKHGAKTQLFTKGKSYTQKWAIIESPAGSRSYKILNAAGGLALATKSNPAANGNNVVVQKRSSAQSQQWTFAATRLLENGLFTIKSSLGTVLDVTGGATAQGTNVQMYKSFSYLRQKWLVSYAGSGYYRFECVNSGRMLGLASNKATNVQLRTASNSDTQLWKPVTTGANTFYFKNKATGKVLDVKGASKKNGANVRAVAQSKKKVQNNAQRWTLVATELLSDGGIYTIHTQANEYMAFSVTEANQNPKTAAYLSGYNKNVISQRFYATKVSSGVYTLESAFSALMLDVTAGASGGKRTVLQEERGSGKSQQWLAQYSGYGTITLTNQLDRTSVLTLNGAAVAGTPLVAQAPVYGGAGQRFVFKDVTTAASRPKLAAGYKAPAKAAPLDGIDVSGWQPANIGTKVDYDFMIVKATQGTWFTSPTLKAQADSAFNRGKRLGLYHFAEKGTDPVAEARYFVSRARPYIGKAILFLDFEAEALKNGREWARTFIREVTRLTGVSCGIYCSSSPATTHKIPKLCADENVLFWNANYLKGYTKINGYNHNIPPALPCNVHQYTSSGRLKGYDKALDLDIYYGTGADWDYWVTH